MRSLKRKKLKKKKSGSSNQLKRLSEAERLIQTGKFAEAETICRQILDVNPKLAKAYTLLASIAFSAGNNSKVVELCRLAAHLEPLDEINYIYLGMASFNLGDYQSAIQYYHEALKINDNNPITYFNLGGTYQEIENFPSAIEAYEKAIALKPDYFKAYNNLGNTYSEYNGDKAVACFNKAIELNPGVPLVHISLGNEYLHQGELESAANSFEEALKLSPGNERALIGLATVLLTENQLEKAHEILAPLWDGRMSRNMDENLGLLYARLCNAMGEKEQAVDVLLQSVQMLENRIPLPILRMYFFNLGKLYDKLGSYEDAFNYYSKGNKLKKVKLKTENNLEKYKRYIEVYSSDKLVCKSSETSVLPIFIVGMPRSGTSLVEQILASHPKVHGAGEVSYLASSIVKYKNSLSAGKEYPEFMHDISNEEMTQLAKQYVEKLISTAGNMSGIERITDKQPSNFELLGYIKRLLPNAKIIHCRRNPMDTCLSCFFQDYHRLLAFSYDLKTLGITYRQYEYLMEFWKDKLHIPMLEVNYEDLVEDQEKMSRKIISYCGLEWDEKCLEFYKSSRIVHTASMDQVRQPIYKKSVKRWKNYEKFLAPLKEGLSQTIPKNTSL